ncbi:uncharacterized protein LOC131244537 [Magnolia sinica]|uniref:uncharacterized protein LOC131244537 n=1 Tax=Magnolia sinica TaxID=86752 RepID=UPI002657F6D2|nr:uncharacterized protein LOC131244537 [Magnolia sinica]
MKPVTRRVISSHPISLSKAARVLSRFVSTNTSSSMSSHALSAYLKRSSSSFNELLQFHRDLKSFQFPSKSHNGNKQTLPETVHLGASPTAAASPPRGDGIPDSFHGGRKREWKMGRDEREGGGSGADVCVDDMYERSEIKKRKNVEAGDGLDNGNEDSSGAKRKKKKKRKD